MATNETAQNPVYPAVSSERPMDLPTLCRLLDLAVHAPPTRFCGTCPNLTSRSKPFSRKMGPKVWKSSDLEQQGLGEQQHNVRRAGEGHTLGDNPGQGKELEATARAQCLAEGPALPWEGEEGRDHRPHLVELSPSMAESISSSQSSSKRPLGEALLQLEPQLHHSRGPPGQRLGYGCWTCQ